MTVTPLLVMDNAWGNADENGTAGTMRSSNEMRKSFEVAFFQFDFVVEEKTSDNNLRFQIFESIIFPQLNLGLS